MSRLAALLIVTAGLSFGQSVTIPSNTTSNPNLINVTTGWLYLNKMHFAGTWSSSATYNAQDVAIYSGAAYISLGIGNLNNTPSGVSVWWTALPSGVSSSAAIIALWTGCSGSMYLGADGVCHAAAGSGTVTSVQIALPNIFSLTGGPITTSGTITGTFVSQAQNLVFASPNGSSGAPGFRSLVVADLSFNQAANGNDTILGYRFTDTTPTGFFARFRNAANSGDLFSIDALGNVKGNSWAGQGSDPALNLPSNTTHSFASGDLVNNAGVLDFNTGAATVALLDGGANGVGVSGSNAILSRTVRTVTGTDSMSVTDCGEQINSTSTSSFVETFTTSGISSGCTLKYTNGAAMTSGAIITFTLASPAVFTGLGQGNANGASSASLYFLAPQSSLDFTFDGTNWNIAGPGQQTLYTAYSTAAGNCLSSDGGSYTFGVTANTCAIATSITAFPLAAFTFPAGMISASTRIRVDLGFGYASGAGSISSAIAIKMGGTAVYSTLSQAGNLSVTNSQGMIRYEINGTAAPSASSYVEIYGGERSGSLIPGWTLPSNTSPPNWAANLATNGTLAMTYSITFASGAGTAVSLRFVKYVWESF